MGICMNICKCVFVYVGVRIGICGWITRYVLYVGIYMYIHALWRYVCAFVYVYVHGGI